MWNPNSRDVATFRHDKAVCGVHRQASKTEHLVSMLLIGWAPILAAFSVSSWTLNPAYTQHEVSRAEKMAFRATDPESYITEFTQVYEDNPRTRNLNPETRNPKSENPNCLSR